MKNSPIHIHNAYKPGAHYPERPPLILSLRDNLCPDWAIFRIVSRECLSLLRSAYGRNQHGKGQKRLRRTDEGCGTSLWSPFFSALISVICGPQWRQTFVGNTSKNSSVWAWVGSRIQCRWMLRVMGSWLLLLLYGQECFANRDINHSHLSDVQKICHSSCRCSITGF